MTRIPAAFLATLMLANALPAAAPLPKPKDIDLVLCLDVSNSMDGLIDSAKIKLWDIVNELAKVKPVPNLRVGLYSYGNTGYSQDKGWVRKDLDLTTDLDEVYNKLNALKTHGGDEYVARVTQTAILDQKWSEEAGALKVVFVCGNEPASQDPEIKLERAAATANKHGVIVNTIYCGNADNAESQGWSRFASLCAGKYANIDQNKKHPVIATPFDKELGELSGKLNTTYLGCGTEGIRGQQNQIAQDANAVKAAPAAEAARALSKAQALYKCSWDLVDKVKSDPKFDLKALKTEDLPEEMRKLKPEERAAYVKQKATEREEIQKKIGDLAAKRARHIEAELKKQPKPAGEIALDEALKSIIREQATAKGFEVKK